MKRPIKPVPELDMAAIAWRLRSLREGRGMPKHALAWDLDVHESSVLVWERGRSIPSTLAIVKYAKYFGVTTDWILFGKE